MMDEFKLFTIPVFTKAGIQSDPVANKKPSPYIAETAFLLTHMCFFVDPPGLEPGLFRTKI
jgi:hypothetical protein